MIVETVEANRCKIKSKDQDSYESNVDRIGNQIEELTIENDGLIEEMTDE